jgi:hypothetical protein
VAFVFLLVFLLSQAVILLFGYGVVCAARRWPYATNVLIGGLVLAGAATIWCGGEVAAGNLANGLRLLLVGLTLVFLGLPTWGLVEAARELKLPAGFTGWAKLLMSYLGACWLFTIGLGIPLSIVVHLTTAPPGSLR